MAGPKSVPQRVQPSRPVRRFTLVQANSALPLVKRIVADIVASHAAAVKLQQRLESLSPGREQIELQRQLEHLTDRLQDFSDELADIGCELKDCQTGLIDFVSRYQGRDIYLCWRLGEDRITHWHELDSGFAGRKSVAVLEQEKK